MFEFNPEYLAAGGNKHPAAADWDAASSLFAYGADNNVALWKPLVVHLQLLGGIFTHWVDRMVSIEVSKPFYVGTLIKSMLLNSSLDQMANPKSY